MFDIENYNYDLPATLIAQEPASERDGSRLMIVRRKEETITESRFFDLPGYLKPGDLLVVNNTRVVPARLFGRKESGGRVEILILEHAGAEHDVPSTRACLLKSSKRPKIGSLLFFDIGITGTVREIQDNGGVRIEFHGERCLDDLLEKNGQMPLPPYIKRPPDGLWAHLDRERYQTIFARNKGAVAAPTAGLHFSETLLEKLRKSGIDIASLTLHVGPGTFRPVRVKDIRKHDVGEEFYRIGPETARAIDAARSQGGRVVAVGTTVVRALESAAEKEGRRLVGEGRTTLLITPGFRFRAVDALITNFHLPKSSLLFLVSAFAGAELIKRAYRLAIERAYRFYSYGDAMFIL